MTKETGLLIGSAIFLFLGIVAGAVFHIYVGMKSNPDVKGANQRYTIINNVRVSCVSVLIATISMWIMWACTYMHQMNPLI